jgi:hypothetical protein
MSARSIQASRPSFAFTEASLVERGFVACRKVGDAWFGVIRMTYGKGRLCAELNLDGYDDSWCYDTIEGAISAMNAWDPEAQTEPDGWMRHINTARRRPDGDASKEYVLR